MKESSIKSPDVYLGSAILTATMPNRFNCWSIGSSKYIKGALQNIEKNLEENFDLLLPKSAKNPS